MKKFHNQFIVFFFLITNVNNLMTSSFRCLLYVIIDIMNRDILLRADFACYKGFQPRLLLNYSHFENDYGTVISTKNSYQKIKFHWSYSIVNYSLPLTEYYITSIDGSLTSTKTKCFTFDKIISHPFEGAIAYHLRYSFPLILKGSRFFQRKDISCVYNKFLINQEETNFPNHNFELGYPLVINMINLGYILSYTQNEDSLSNSLGEVNEGQSFTRNV